MGTKIHCFCGAALHFHVFCLLIKNDVSKRLASTDYLLCARHMTYITSHPHIALHISPHFIEEKIEAQKR